MAEPVGITGTAVGIVSFGLQLYTGISEYLDAVRGRDEDLQSAKQYAMVLRNYLKSIEETMNAIGNDYTVARYAVEQCKSSCETELKGLEELLQQLTGRSTDPAICGQAKNSLRKFTYPFKKKNITRLQERLNSTNSVLNMATLALQLAISDNTCTTIASLQKTADAIHKTTENTASGIAEQAIALKQANQTLTESHQEIQLVSQRMSKSLDTRIDEILTHLRNTESPRSQIIQLLQYPQDLQRICDSVSKLSHGNPATAPDKTFNAKDAVWDSCSTREGLKGPPTTHQNAASRE
ncbi:hypothetical protein FGADI_271 [Fusarium gaditjirri]|uniref:Azaphilone pigments biosynthesis cluster protein L N-terminal domain-containing protein n=1 Tax=Fusarium gaditjirri TaxID=282569 RepID=A0A8H4TP46_9HYPO|nr:hypothetical protein FGADI_271 [Fusarium gaditjirri]